MTAKNLDDLTKRHSEFVTKNGQYYKIFITSSSDGKVYVGLSPDKDSVLEGSLLIGYFTDTEGGDVEFIQTKDGEINGGSGDE